MEKVNLPLRQQLKQKYIRNKGQPFGCLFCWVKMIKLIDISIPELNELIDSWIFNERNRQILKARLINGKTYEQIGELFELSDSQVKRIISKGTETIASKIPKDKIKTEYRTTPKMTRNCTKTELIASC